MDETRMIRELTDRVATLEALLAQVSDIEQIKRLKYRYCLYNDGGWGDYGPTHNGEYEEIFAEDMVWSGGENFPVVVGRENVLQYFKECQLVPFCYHGAMNPVLTIEGDTAEGHWHLFAYAIMPDGKSRWILANHVDKYVRTPQGWRYKEIRADVARVWADGMEARGSASERLL